MPLALEAPLSPDTVTSTHEGGTVDGRVTSADPGRHTVDGTVSRRVADAFDPPIGSAGSAYYVRVKLADEWIPENELAGPVTIDRQLDAHGDSFEFGLFGRRWSIFATERTWTRTPVEIHRWVGRLGAEMVALEPLVGYVRTASQSHDPEPVLRLRCGDASTLYERSTVCLEVEPFAGLRRGEIVALALRSAGITDFDVPLGEVYYKGVQAFDEGIFDWLADFIAPEGWSFRWRGPRLEIFRPEIVRPPRPAAAEWNPDRWISARVTPPSNVPSSWTLRGSRAVIAAEDGIETTTTVTEIRAPYAPRVAVAWQRGGQEEDLIPTSFVNPPEQERVVSRLVERQSTEGGRLVRSEVEEWGWYNLAAARLVSWTAGNAFLFWSSFLDADGRHVAWNSERFIRIRQEVTTPTHEETGNLIETRVEHYRYGLIPKGVGPTASESVTVDGAFVFDDDQSYSSSVERWGKHEEQVISYEYDADTGARTPETQETFRFYSPRVRVDASGAAARFRLYSGDAQAQAVAEWRRVERRVKHLILSRDGEIRGETEAEFSWSPPPTKHDGAFDWGDFRSNGEEERFRFRKQTAKRYDVLNDAQIEVETRDGDGTPRRQTLLAGRPLPAFESSAWTRLAQRALEARLDDSTAAAWFGAEQRALVSDHVQSTAEALAMIERLRRRALAPKLEITRWIAPLELGDTVEAADPPAGFFGRGVVVAIRETWNLAAADFSAVITLEIWP